MKADKTIVIIISIMGLFVFIPKFVQSWPTQIDINDILARIEKEQDEKNKSFGPLARVIHYRHESLDPIKYPRPPRKINRFSTGMPPFMLGMCILNILVAVGLVFYLLGGPETLQREKATCAQNECFSGCKPERDDEFWPHETESSNKPQDKDNQSNQKKHHHHHHHHHHHRHSDEFAENSHLTIMSSIFPTEDSIN